MKTEDTIQFTILTGMKARCKRDGTMSPNVFFKARREYVEQNFDEAEEVYRDVFRSFISTWLVRYSQGLVDYIPPRSLERLAV